MVSFDFLTKPISIDSGINILCIENKALYRKVLLTLINKNENYINVVFSDDYKPFDVTKNIEVIYNYYNLSFSNSFIKKTYDDIALYCRNELQQEFSDFKQYTEILFSRLVSDFDYDFDYNDDFELSNYFKAIDLKPSISNEDVLSSLQQYILLLNKYSKIKCFVLIGLYQNFDAVDLVDFYKELEYNQVKLLIIENSFHTERIYNEKLTIIDNDLCEIIENSQ